MFEKSARKNILSVEIAGLYEGRAFPVTKFIQLTCSSDLMKLYT